MTKLALDKMPELTFAFAKAPMTDPGMSGAGIVKMYSQ